MTSLPLVPLSLYQDSRESGALTGKKKWKEAPEVRPRERKAWNQHLKCTHVRQEGHLSMPTGWTKLEPTMGKTQGLDISSIGPRVSGNQRYSQSEQPTSQGQGTPAKSQRHSTPSLFERSISSAQFSHSVMCDSLRPHEPQHARLP